jgi:serine/threonine protein kinase
MALSVNATHPNIVTAYDADQAGDFHFMVMEYVDGVDLSQTVKVHGALPVAEACDYIRQAALGLQHAHERGMVHRDIKPHNLMVTAEGIIKILDFGLASLTPEAIPASDSAAACSDLTAAGAIMGTPDFISPEQAQAESKQSFDASSILRHALIPTDFASEGDGWERFGITDYFARPNVNDYYVSGPLQKLPPVLHDNPRKNDVLTALANEVEDLLSQHPEWKAGVAVLGYLQAELGNESQAVALFEKALADEESPMPPNSAWAFALVLEGKGKQLDQTVMQLYKRKISGPKDEGRALRHWPSKNLARLYAKYDRGEEARELLFELAKPETEIVCAPGHLNKDQNSCVRCHRTDRSFDNFTVLSSELSGIGYPVDAYLQLARIDASYHNLLSSDKEWAANNAIDHFDIEFASQAYHHARVKAVDGITPAAVLRALRDGRFTNQDKYSDDLDLAVSIRGEGGKPTVFSPVVEVLQLAARAKGDEAAIDNLQIDRLLAEEFIKNRGNIETGIAATIFAFLRNDVEEAKKRAEHLIDLVPDANTPPNGIALWLIARYALENESAKPLGERLARLAIAAAERQSNPLWQAAIQAGFAPTDRKEDSEEGKNDE